MVVYLYDKNKEDAVMTREELRRENARKLASGKGGKAAFARLLAMEPSQVSQLIGPKPIKNIGNSIARRIERAHDLPEGWLDVAHPEMAMGSEEGADASSASGLAERLIWAREQKGLTQAALAEQSGVAQSMIGNLESGIRSSARKIIDIATALDVDPIWLANGQGAAVPSKLAVVRPGTSVPNASGDSAPEPAVGASPFVRGGARIRVGDEPDTIPIRRVAIRLRAGFTGFETVPELEEGGVLHVPRLVIEDQKLTPHHLLAVGVHGCSMEPLLFEGDMVVIDMSDKEPISRELYAVNWNFESCVKQLVHEGGQWYLRSMHHEHPPINVASGHCEIIGRVVYQPGRVMKGRL